jgi:tetratricopeptide (TPR) repeat protein
VTDQAKPEDSKPGPGNLRDDQRNTAGQDPPAGEEAGRKPSETEGSNGDQSEEVKSAEANLLEIEARLRNDPHDQAALLEASRFYHRLAMTGQEAAFDKADRAVTRLLRLDKHNVEALAISGSLLTIKARRTPSLFKRIYYAFKAARRLDKAVKTDPANLSARTIRAFTALVLPGFLKRLGRAVDDFEYLIRLKSESPSSLPDEMMPKVYFNLGLAYAKGGDKEHARQVLSEVTSRFPNTRESARAHHLLQRL